MRQETRQIAIIVETAIYRVFALPNAQFKTK